MQPRTRATLSTDARTDVTSITSRPLARSKMKMTANGCFPLEIEEREITLPRNVLDKGFQLSSLRCGFRDGSDGLRDLVHGLPLVFVFARLLDLVYLGIDFRAF